MTIQTEDLREKVARLTAYAEKIGRRAEILRQFADQQADQGYQATADADADGEELLAADLRAILALVSSTKGGGDLEHLCGSGAQVRPARGLGEPTATPSGWVLVPRQSTLDMEKAGGDADVVNGKSARERNVACGVIWKAMIDAAPAPPSNKKEG